MDNNVCIAYLKRAIAATETDISKAEQVLDGHKQKQAQQKRLLETLCTVQDEFDNIFPAQKLRELSAAAPMTPPDVSRHFQSMFAPPIVSSSTPAGVNAGSFLLKWGGANGKPTDVASEANHDADAPGTKKSSHDMSCHDHQAIFFAQSHSYPNAINKAAENDHFTVVKWLLENHYEWCVYCTRKWLTAEFIQNVEITVGSITW